MTKAILNRVVKIIIRPAAEWQTIRNESTTSVKLLLRSVLPLAAIPPLAAIAGSILFDRRLANGSLSSPFSSVLMANMIWYAMYIMNVVITGMVIASILTATDSRWNGLRGFALAAYSYTPLFLAGLFAALPRMGWVLYPAILYAIWLLYLGIISMTNASRAKAVLLTLSSFTAAAVIVGVMNLVEYMFESSVAKLVL